jgi:hypothetical protein
MTATIAGATVRSIMHAFGAPRLGRSDGSTQGGIQMADRASRYSGGWEQQATPSSAIGLVLFAAVMMILVGIFQGVAGLVALVNDNFYLATREYVFQFDLTTWGWTHLILGIVVALAGVGLLAGRIWARVVGISLAALSAIANFLFIPHHPVWALLVIALDIFVIWALAAHGGELRDTGP